MRSKKLLKLQQKKTVKSMAKNPPKGSGRVGSVKGRSQVYNPKTKLFVKINENTGLFMDNMSKPNTKFKGVRTKK